MYETFWPKSNFTFDKKSVVGFMIVAEETVVLESEPLLNRRFRVLAIVKDGTLALKGVSAIFGL